MGCGSLDTELYRGDDGRFRRACGDCDHVGGPFASDDIRGRDEGPPSSGQAGLGDFA
jgi:hypothetical protein